MLKMIYCRSVHMIRNMFYIPVLFSNLHEAFGRSFLGIFPALGLTLLLAIPSAFVSFCLLQEGGDYTGP